MADAYHDGVAAHYRAFRPPLHERILSLCLGEQKFVRALDVGCGTGYSSRALLGFAETIDAVDPSTAMLEAAAPHDRIRYHHGGAESLSWLAPTFDLITFAGSLFYVDARKVLPAIERVLLPGGTVVVYDFEVVMQPWWDRLSLKYPYVAGTYDHRRNFSGLPTTRIKESFALDHTIDLAVNTDQLAHLLLADEPVYAQWTKRVGNNLPPHQQLKEAIIKHTPNDQPKVSARLFATVYYDL